MEDKLDIIVAMYIHHESYVWDIMEKVDQNVRAYYSSIPVHENVNIPKNEIWMRDRLGNFGRIISDVQT